MAANPETPVKTATITIDTTTRAITFESEDHGKVLFEKSPPRQLGDTIPQELPYWFRGQNANNELIIINMAKQSTGCIHFEGEAIVRVGGNQYALHQGMPITEQDNTIKIVAVLKAPERSQGQCGVPSGGLQPPGTL